MILVTALDGAFAVLVSSSSLTSAGPQLDINPKSIKQFLSVQETRSSVNSSGVWCCPPGVFFFLFFAFFLSELHIIMSKYLRICTSAEPLSIQGQLSGKGNIREVTVLPRVALNYALTLRILKVKRFGMFVNMPSCGTWGTFLLHTVPIKTARSLNNNPYLSKPWQRERDTLPHSEAGGRAGTPVFFLRFSMAGWVWAMYHEWHRGCFGWQRTPKPVKT